MNLRRVRLRLTLLYGLVSLVAVGLVAAVALHAGTARIRDDLEHEVQHHAADIVVALRAGEDIDDGGAWLVFPDDGGAEPLGDPYTEPPLQTLALNAGDYENFDTFTQGGSTWLAYARALGGGQVVVTIVDKADADRRVASLRLRLGAGAALVVLLAFGAGALLAGRSLRPARQVLADQSGFLADAAHELRTPLSVIQASASQALSRERRPEEYVRSLAEIRAAAERAAAGVSQLLELARLDAGHTLPRLAPLRLDLLAEEVAVSVSTDGCVIEAPPGPTVVVGADMALLRQALDNVVRNASRRSQHVVVRSWIDGRDGVVEIADDGPGFDPEQLPHLFDRFRRGDESGSAGLGLAIVRSILAIHGGTVEAENRPQGGAVFRLRVPLAQADYDG